MSVKKILFMLVLVLGLVSFNSPAENYPEPTAKNNVWGYAFLNGGFRLTIDYQFDEADAFDANFPRARVRIGNEYYLIDQNGKKCAGPYEQVAMWAEPATGYYIFSSGDKQGIIDMNGTVVLEPKYTNLSFDGNGKAVGLLNGDYVEISLTK